MRRSGLDDRSDGPAAVGVEQVARAVDLAVVVVRRAGAAQAAARRQDRRVREEDADRVVVAGDGLGRERRKGGGHGVPHFGLELAAIIGEGNTVVLAA